ncbi:serine hydrolase domain-containing protein [Dyadobacter psychrotolerans]|uniref:Class A beta-lactamase-related serine hydrolase n=1 Tax=Dyadobacter psychrotolerans TaxID=2541721 RepID=A0A4V2Z4N2_9BACT|nr:serine hydrolase domain-containing protein [Dyadobacter psychrotolerans]TDE17278.1 class A beta-lactamase-related serine hydrolase [Dyadobacter psychrotolerans]
MTKILVSFLAAWFSLACSKQNVRPDGKNLPYDFTTVDQFIDKNLANYNNQVVVLVSQNGKLIYHKSAGLDTTATRPTASASKWLSAAVVMSLVDDKKISLDDTVGKFLPIFTANRKGSITIRQLFSHTAGFDGDSQQGFEYQRNITLAEAVDSIARYVPLVYAPGSAFSYGSSGIHIAGRVAELVSGKSWQVLFNEKIGRPCGITVRYGSVSNPIIAGGANTSAADYLKFLEMIVSKGLSGKKRVLSEEAVSVMLSDQTRNAVIKGTPYPTNPFSPYPDNTIRYGIGNWLDVVDAGGIVWESSSPGLFGAHAWQDSKNKIAGIIFTQTTPRKSTQTSLEIRKLIRDIVEKR